jgi:hypothetical protein
VKFVIFFLGVNMFLFKSNAQGEKDFSIYLGNVVGINKAEFISKYSKYDFRKDSILGLTPISKSVYPIEIRLYEGRGIYIIGAETCTIIRFDTSFSISRITKVHDEYDGKYSINYSNPIENVNPKDCFSQLVENGIFGMLEYTKYFVNPKILTEKGLQEYKGFCGSTDGYSYQIQVKVDTLFKYVYHNTNEEAQLLCYIDNVDLMRRKKIVSILRANTLLTKK